MCPACRAVSSTACTSVQRTVRGRPVRRTAELGLTGQTVSGSTGPGRFDPGRRRAAIRSPVRPFVGSPQVQRLLVHAALAAAGILAAHAAAYGIVHGHAAEQAGTHGYLPVATQLVLPIALVVFAWLVGSGRRAIRVRPGALIAVQIAGFVLQETLEHAAGGQGPQALIGHSVFWVGVALQGVAVAVLIVATRAVSRVVGGLLCLRRDTPTGPSLPARCLMPAPERAPVPLVRGICSDARSPPLLLAA